MNRYSPARVCSPAIIAVLLSVSALSAGNHYVRPPGTTTTVAFPYDTWDKAATNIQQAVDAAMASLPATVWVTNGAYCVTGQVVVTTSVVVRSVSGWTNTLVYADFPAYTTRCFFIAHGGVIKGFSITNGHDSSVKGGGGVYAITNAAVLDCRLAYNTASNTAGPGGGGIYASVGSLVSNCHLIGNVAYVSWYGGGGITLGSNSMAAGCVVISNRQLNAGYAGGIDCYGPLAVVSNCLIAMNSSTHGGGGARAGYITDCVISNNSGGGSAGGIVNDWVARTIIRNSIIVNNTEYGNGGGGIRLGDSGNPNPVLVSNCTIAGNYSRNGGGIFMGSSMGVIDSCRISNNINALNKGGGGIQMSLRGQVRNCIINNNINSSSTGNGGGIYMASAAAITTTPYGVYNCIIRNNHSVNEGGGLALFGLSNLVANCIIFGNSSSSNLYPDIYATGDNNTNSFWSCCADIPLTPLPPLQGNITNDPMFVDAAAGNYRLNVNSPCVNAGWNQAWMTNAADLDGQKRILYGIVDIGPFERIYSGSVYNFR